MALRVYNTLTKQKEPFQTVRPGKVGMYVCGPTVYKPSHVGHMVGPVIFDAVKRYLTYLGYEVDWVVNITSTFFRKLIHESRLNYVLNVALLLDVIVVVVTGIVVSETLGLRLGLSNVRITDLQTIHAYSSHLSLVLTALHVALHWRWIATNAAKYLFRLPSPNNKAQPTLERRGPAMPTQRESESLP